MAINRNTTFRADDMSFMDKDFDNSFDLADQNKVKKAIKLIFAPIKGIAKGTFNRLVDENLTNLDSANELLSSFQDEAEKSASELKKNASEAWTSVKEVGANYTESLRGVLPKKTYRKLKRAFETEEESYDATPSPEQRRENEIKASITSIFGKAAAQQAEGTAAMLKSAAADRAINHAYMKYNFSVAAATNENVSSIQHFLSNVYTRYLEKDIELKYRSLHISTEIKKHIDTVASAFDKRGLMEELLETAKLTDKEKGDINYQNKSKFSRKGTKAYGKDIPKQIIENLSSIPDIAISVLQIGTMMLGMNAPQNGVGVIEKVSQAIAQNIPESWIPKFLKTEKMKKIFGETKKSMRVINNDIGSFVENFPLFINSLARKAQQSGGLLGDLVSFLLPTFSRDTTSKNKAATDPEGPAQFDNLTRESITSVIPKHLERIGDYMEALSKALGAPEPNDDTSKTYDVTTRSLVSKTKLNAKVTDYIYGTAEDRERRANTSLRTISDNLVISKANEEVWKDFSESTGLIQEFFNRSADQLISIDTIALNDILVNRNDASDETKEYVKKTFGVTRIDDNVLKAVRVIVNSIMITDDKGNTHVSNALRNNINTRITRLGKDIDDQEKRRETIEKRGIYNTKDYNFDLEGTAAPKNSIRYAGMRHDLQNEQEFMESARSVSWAGQSVEKQVKDVEDLRNTATNKQERDLMDAATGFGLDTPAIIRGTGLRYLANAGNAIANAPLIRNLKIKERISGLIGGSAAVANSLFIRRIKILNDKTGEFLVTYQKGTDKKGTCVVKVTISDLNLKNVKMEFGSGLKQKPSKELESLGKRIAAAIAKNSDLKAQGIVDDKTKVRVSYTPNLWVELGIDESIDSPISSWDDEYEESQEETASKNQKSQINISRPKSVLELIQEDVRALRTKLVGAPLQNYENKVIQPKPKKETAEEAAPVKSTDIPTQQEEKKEEQNNQEQPASETSETATDPLLQKFINAKEALSKKKDEFVEITGRKILDNKKVSSTLNFLNRHHLDFGLKKKFDRAKKVRDRYERLKGATVLEALNLTEKDLEEFKAKKDRRAYAEALGMSEQDVFSLLGIDPNEVKEKSGPTTSEDIPTSPDTSNIENELYEMDQYYTDSYMTPGTQKTVEKKKSIPEQLNDAINDVEYKLKRDLGKEKRSWLLKAGRNGTISHIASILKRNGFKSNLLDDLSRKHELSETVQSIRNKIAADEEAKKKLNNDIYSMDQYYNEAYSMVPGQAPAKVEVPATKKTTLLNKAFNSVVNVFSFLKKKKTTMEQVAKSAIAQGATPMQAMTIALLSKSVQQNESIIKNTKDTADKAGKGGSDDDDMLDDLLPDDAKKWKKMFKNVKFLRKHKWARNLAKLSPKRLLTKSLPRAVARVGGWGKILGPAAGALAGAGMGFGGSRTSGGSKTSTAFSTLTGAGAGGLLAASASNPVGWALLAALAANSVREGWNDDKTLKKSWGASENVQDYKKGATAMANITNYATFGLLNKLGGRKYLDWLNQYNIQAHMIGGIGGTIAGIGDMTKSLFRDEGSSMNSLEMRQARAKLQTDIKRGVPGAREKLAEFDNAVKEKNWYRARDLSGIHVDSAKEFGKGLKRTLKGAAAWGSLGLTSVAEMMWDKAIGNADEPMSEKEIQKAIKNFAILEKKDPSIKSKRLDFEEAVLGERWAIARKIAHMEHQGFLTKKFGKAASVGSIIAGVAYGPLGALVPLLIGNNENEPMSDKEVEKFSKEMRELAQKGNKKALDVLDEFETAVASGNWKRARALSGKETHSILYKMGAMAYKNFTRFTVLGRFFWNNSTPLTEKEIDNFRKKMEYLKSKGDTNAAAKLDQFNIAVTTGQWEVARKISRIKHQSHFMKDLTSSWKFWVTGDKDKPLDENEIKKFRESMQRKIAMGNTAAERLLEKFDDAVGRQEWAMARKLCGKETIGALEKIVRADMSIRKSFLMNVIDPAHIFRWDNDNQMSEDEVKKFRARMMKLVDNGNPKAKDILDKFDDAVADGDWKRARKISGIEDRSVVGGALKWTMDLLNDEYETDEKDVSDSKPAQRYRLLIDRVKEAIQKKKSERDRAGFFRRPFVQQDIFDLVGLQEEMQSLNVLELDDELLDKYEERLRKYDKSVGLTEETDINEYEQQRKSKQTLVKQKENLLEEIVAAQERCGWWQWVKRSQLKRLFTEVSDLTMDELDQELLDSYDEELRTIDSQAVSTKSFNEKDRKIMAERIKRQNTVIGNIDEVYNNTSWYHFGTLNALRKLKGEVESTLPEDMDDDLFTAWDQELKDICPQAHDSKVRSSEELKKIKELNRKRLIFVGYIREAIDDCSWYEFSKKSKLKNLLSEVESELDEDLTDDLLHEWELDYQSITDTDKSISEMSEEEKEHKKLLRDKRKLRVKMRISSKQHLRKNDKSTAKDINKIIDSIDAVPDDEFTRDEYTDALKEFSEIDKEAAAALIAENEKTKVEEAAKKAELEQEKKVQKAADEQAKEEAKNPLTNFRNLVNDFKASKGAGLPMTGTTVPILSSAIEASEQTKVQSKDIEVTQNGWTFSQHVHRSSHFDFDSGKQRVTYTVDNGEPFDIRDLRNRSLYEQLAVLAIEVGRAYLSDHNSERGDKIEDLLDDIEDHITSKLTFGDLDKYEKMAASYGINPYANPDLYDLPQLYYDEIDDKDTAKAASAKQSKISIPSWAKGGIAAFKRVSSFASKIMDPFGIIKKGVTDPIGLGKKTFNGAMSFAKKGLSSITGLFSFGKKNKTEESNTESTENKEDIHGLSEEIATSGEPWENVKRYLKASVYSLGTIDLPDGTTIGRFNLREQDPFDQLIYLERVCSAARALGQFRVSSDKGKALRAFLKELDAKAKTGKITLKELAELEETARDLGVTPYKGNWVEPLELDEDNSNAESPIDEKIEEAQEIKSTISGMSRLKSKIKYVAKKLIAPYKKLGLKIKSALGPLARKIASPYKKLGSAFANIFKRKSKSSELLEHEISNSSTTEQEKQEIEVMKSETNRLFINFSLSDLRNYDLEIQYKYLWFELMKETEGGRRDDDYPEAAELREQVGKDILKVNFSNIALAKYERRAAQLDIMPYSRIYACEIDPQFDPKSDEYGYLGCMPIPYNPDEDPEVIKVNQLNSMRQKVLHPTSAIIKDITSAAKTSIIKSSLGIEDKSEDNIEWGKSANENITNWHTAKSINGTIVLQDGTQFRLQQLRDQKPYNQLIYLYFHLFDYIGKSAAKDVDPERYKDLCNAVYDKLSSGNVTLEELAKFEAVAKELHITPYYGNWGLEPIELPKEEVNIPELKLNSKYTNVSELVNTKLLDKDAIKDMKVSSDANAPKVEYNDRPLAIESKYTNIAKLQEQNILKDSLNADGIIEANKEGTGEICNSLNVNANMLNAIFHRLGDVVDAVSEHNVKVNNNINSSMQQSYEFMKDYTNKRFDTKKVVNPPLFKPPVVSIYKA